jgi:hypothetical protein
MVTIQALALIMGVKQSPAYLSIAFQDIAKGLEDEELKWFLQFLRYLDDLQIRISARELMEFQEKADLEDPDLNLSCQDPDCCSFVGDLSPPVRMCWWSWYRPMNNAPLGTSSDLDSLEKTYSTVYV